MYRMRSLCQSTLILPGDSIIEVGRAQLFLPEGQSAEVKYVVEWKQEGGAWKWHTDIWNMNA
jgi:hypothetical protein